VGSVASSTAINSTIQKEKLSLTVDSFRGRLSRAEPLAIAKTRRTPRQMHRMAENEMGRQSIDVALGVHQELGLGLPDEKGCRAAYGVGIGR